MNSTSPASDFLAQQRIVLVATSHPGNVGSAARAIKTMGLQQLHLVTPRFANVLQHPDAIALASGATDVLARASVHDSLENAVGDCQLTIALTSRQREFAAPVCDLEVAVAEVRSYLQQHSSAQVAWVLGSERYGLSNQQVQQCQRVCSIPTNPAYPSLNLAQAVQLIAYECRRQMLLATPAMMAAAPDSGHAPQDAHDVQQDVHYAQQNAITQMLSHLEQAMIAVNFLNPQQPKKLLPRLQRLFARSHLTPEEVKLLRGLCSAMIETAQRAGRVS